MGNPASAVNAKVRQYVCAHMCLLLFQSKTDGVRMCMCISISNEKHPLLDMGLPEGPPKRPVREDAASRERDV